MGKCSWPEAKGKNKYIKLFFQYLVNVIYLFAYTYIHKYVHTYLLEESERKLEKKLYQNNSCSLWEVIYYIYFSVFSIFSQSSFMFVLNIC